jgi:SAM-dependent methyltransferase
MALTDCIGFIKDASKGMEIEVSLSHKKPMTLKEYVSLLETHGKRHKEQDLKVTTEISLDVAYNYDHERLSSHRVSVYGLKHINDALNSVSLRENHVVFAILLNKSRNDANIVGMTKTRTKKDIVDVPDLSLRIRNSKEEEIAESEVKKLLQLQNTEKEYITYRFKERLSLIIHDDEFVTLRTDITKVQQSNKIQMLPKVQPKFEAEVELMVKAKINEKSVQKYYTMLEKEVTLMNKILQGSWQVIGKEEADGVVSELKKIMIGDGTIKSDLPGMQVRSLELTQIVDSIPTNYSVTDKADGERNFLFVKHSNVYLISTNMAVKKIDSNKRFQDWEDSILDGEYIYLPEANKYLFLSFDMMFYKGLDIRNEVNLQARLDKMYDIMTKVFDQKVVPNAKNHEKTLREFMKDLNAKLERTKQHVIMGKYFMMPDDKKTTIFTGSSLMWRLYTSDKEFACPYTLDGLIYTSTLQKYTVQNKEIIHPIYKWKPGSKNSIDFYVEFEKDPETGQIINVYDNTVDEMTTGEDDTALEEKTAEVRTQQKVYRILKLFVGRKDNSREFPVLFQKDKDNYIAKLYVDRGEIRDIEGKMIQDKTVVEFAYNNDLSLEKNFRWVPLRTRFDKTEMVQSVKRKYGNNEFIADSIWRSMMDPIEATDIDLLGDPKTHDTHMKLLRTKVKDDALLIKRKEDAYYQEVTKEVPKTMRKFHNYLKTCMINTYCKAKFGKKYSVLDIACGKGGDIDKFYHARVAYYVGVDEDEHGINSVVDGAKKRYSDLRRTKPDAPKMQFFVADASLPLGYNEQYTKYGKTIEQNRSQMIEYFGENSDSKDIKQFDIVNCQLALHYFLKDDTTWGNFKNTIKKHLRKGGYFLFTTLDANLVHKQFNNTTKITEHYTTEEGKQNLLFEIIRLYPDNTKNFKTTGLPINVHMSWISNEGVYIPEYLVEPGFVIAELETTCGLKLIESETFGSFKETHRHFFEDIYQFESLDRTKKTLRDCAPFYNMKDPLIASLHRYSAMHRYYIFRMM